MGKLINSVDIFRMRRLEADVERAESHADNVRFHEEFAQMLFFNQMRKLSANNIILPEKPEGQNG